MMRRCCGGVIAAELLLQLGAKQGENVYLAGQLLPSFLSYTCAEQRLCNHACCRYVVTCYEPTCANAELIVDFN